MPLKKRQIRIFIIWLTSQRIVQIGELAFWRSVKPALETVPLVPQSMNWQSVWKWKIVAEIYAENEKKFDI